MSLIKCNILKQKLFWTISNSLTPLAIIGLTRCSFIILHLASCIYFHEQFFKPYKEEIFIHLYNVMPCYIDSHYNIIKHPVASGPTSMAESCHFQVMVWNWGAALFGKCQKPSPWSLVSGHHFYLIFASLLHKYLYTLFFYKQPVYTVHVCYFIRHQVRDPVLKVSWIFFCFLLFKLTTEQKNIL